MCDNVAASYVCIRRSICQTCNESDISSTITAVGAYCSEEAERNVILTCADIVASSTIDVLSSVSYFPFFVSVFYFLLFSL